MISMMSNDANITYKDKQIFITGELNFFNVVSLYQQSLLLFDHYPELKSELRFDFSGLTSSDSSGLALIIEWIKFAKRNNAAITFSHISKDIRAVAKVAGLDKLIDGNHSHARRRE